MIDLEADDDRLVTAFHRGTLTSFPHRDHVRVAWILLEQFGSDGALEAMRSGIRSMAIAAGLLAKYHETRTVAWMRVIDAARTHPFTLSDEFVNAHPELLRAQLLDDFYSAEILRSDTARAVFTEPDRAPLP